MTPIAIIPARMGSKRFPGKNLARLSGKPLLARTLELATSMSIFRRVIVSSESPEVGELAQSYRAEWHDRPVELAGDSATVDDVLRGLPVPHDVVLYVLLPTSPLRSPLSVKLAWEYFTERQPDVDGLLSIARANPHPLWSLQWDGLLVSPMFPLSLDQPRPHLNPLYFHDGGHYIVKRAALESKPEHRAILGWLSPEDESLDIDEPEDLKYAEYLLGTGKARN